MGFSDIVYLIKERINMTKETMKQTINTIQSLDGMKAVKVAFDLSQKNMDSITKVTEVVSLIDNNLKELATKVIKLEKALDLYETDLTKLDKRLELVEDGLERVVKKQVEDYERSLN